MDSRLHRIVAAQPYPLLFATISGAHLYGFPSPDSDMTCAILLRRWRRFDYDSQGVAELAAAGGGEHFFGNFIGLPGINELARKFRRLIEVALE